jgi:hypothetical protein
MQHLKKYKILEIADFLNHNGTENGAPQRLRKICPLQIVILSVTASCKVNIAIFCRDKLLSTKVEPSLKVTHKIITAPHG